MHGPDVVAAVAVAAVVAAVVAVVAVNGVVVVLDTAIVAVAEFGWVESTMAVAQIGWTCWERVLEQRPQRGACLYCWMGCAVGARRRWLWTEDHCARQVKLALVKGPREQSIGMKPTTLVVHLHP